MKKFSKCMALCATLSLLSSLFFSCKQEPDDPVVTEISVFLEEQGKIFVEGDTLSKDDVVVTALYSNGKTRNVTNRAKFTPELPKTLSESFTLKAEYDEKTADLKIEVGKKDDYYKNEAGEYIKLKEISLALKESNKEFFEGDAISKDDFVVTAKYEDDTTKEIKEADGVIFEGITDEKLTVGEKTIKATFGSQSKSLEITVHKKGATVESISIVLKSGKTYIEGDTISESDFIVTAKFSDNTTETVTSKAQFTGLGKTTAAGKVKITATYSSKTASITVMVAESSGSESMLYIAGDFSESDWSFVPMEKEGNCFYYEFKETGVINFDISKIKTWSSAFGVTAIPQTGVYVALKKTKGGEDATVDIANPGDRIYVRCENEIYYVRYAAKGEIVNPNEEMEIVESILFDIGFDDVDKIGLKYFPEYMLEGERFNVGVVEDSESTPCTYEYQWYKNGEEVVGATSKESPTFEEKYFYYCIVTATAKDNPRNVIKKRIPEFYICNKDMDDVSLSSNKITLTNATKTEDLWVTSPYCDSIEWEVSDPFVLSLDGYNDIDGHKTYNVSIRALMNGDSTITVTMTKRGEKKSVTCDVTVSGLSVVEEEYSWWYYVLDTSKASNLQSVGLIFNDGKNSQTKDIKNVQSTGEIFYKWNGASRTVLAKIDKSKVDESILQTGVDTEKKLVVYVSVPTRVSSVYLHTWDMYISGGFTFTGESWPGAKMNKCTANGETSDDEIISGGSTTE